MTRKDYARLYVLWFIAILLLLYHGTLLFFNAMPSSHWFQYYSVLPKKEVIRIGEPLLFVSHLDVNRDISMSFNDILFRWDEQSKSFERFCSQNTFRIFAVKGKDKYSVWPFNNSPSRPGKYCLESNIQIHLPLGVHREQQFDGCSSGVTFEVIN